MGSLAKTGATEGIPIARESQFQVLKAALSSPTLPQALFLWGLTSTGKTFVLNGVIEISDITCSARLSATEIMCGRRPFFETLLRQLQSDENAEDCNTKCDNIRQFIRQLDVVYKCHQSYLERKTVIIIDDAEYLIKEHSDILNIFARLQEFVQINICVIFSSSLTPMSFRVPNMTNMRSISTLHFPQYSKDEIVSIITKCYAPSRCDNETFESYVRMVINVFYQRCRDLKKLLRLTTANWEYVKRHSEGLNNVHKIWKQIEPRLGKDFKALNSHFLPMTDRKTSEYESKSNSSNQPSSTSTSLDLSKNYDSIPQYTRFILVASYLATHNPPSSDKRFFVKLSTRKLGKKAKYNVGACLEENENSSERTRALRSFDLNRLKSLMGFLVHYCSAGSAHLESNVDINVQLTSLSQSRFIQHLGEDTTGNFKFRCLADYDFIKNVSESINFELDKHLYRFL